MRFLAILSPLRECGSCGLYGKTDAILDFAKNSRANLIVKISKDYNFLQKQFLDITLEKVSFNTAIPLLTMEG